MLCVKPVFKGEQADPASLAKDLGGKPGNYKVQFLLSRPGQPISGEREHKFIDNVMGDSYVAIAKPLVQRGAADVDRMLMQVAGEAYQFVGLPNDRGFLGKVVVESMAAVSSRDAQDRAHVALARFLSAWSLHLDVPVHIETIQTTEVTTQVHWLRVVTPHFDMAFGAGPLSQLSDDFCHYASLYREGLNTNSRFYRFLCFYKVIESLERRRNRVNGERSRAGQTIQVRDERLPRDRTGVSEFLRRVYPWRSSWDDMSIEQLFPSDVWGRNLSHVKNKFLNPLRTGISHALLETGEIRISIDHIEHIQEVNKWLPLCRVLARLMLCNEFPKEFAFAMPHE